MCIRDSLCRWGGWYCYRETHSRRSHLTYTHRKSSYRPKENIFWKNNDKFKSFLAARANLLQVPWETAWIINYSSEFENGNPIEINALINSKSNESPIETQCKLYWKSIEIKKDNQLKLISTTNETQLKIQRESIENQTTINRKSIETQLKLKWKSIEINV